MNKLYLIETDEFQFEFLSQLAERESWRKELHRPIYHTHKWWAKRLGSVFRGILLGSILGPDTNISEAFYSSQNFSTISVFDPFMGSGTTIGEAHKLGLVAIGQDINPVSAESVRVALGPMDYSKLKSTFEQLSTRIGEQLRKLYWSTDLSGRICDVLYYFWVMQIPCPFCITPIDLFPSWIVARNAYPSRKPEIQVLCPSCGDIFPSINGIKEVQCRSCKLEFLPDQGTARGAMATCDSCKKTFSIISAIAKENKRPNFRLYGKLLLTEEGRKEYLPVTRQDLTAYNECSKELEQEESNGSITIPRLALAYGYNTKQAMSYGFRTWRDFFNDRQLLGLGLLQKEIVSIPDQEVRDVFLILFSGILEFHNMFASYKGEGTGAVRPMFSHHILKPERTPIEANIWGTSKSSGSFSTLFRSRLLRAVEYHLQPTELYGTSGDKSIVCSKPLAGKVEISRPVNKDFLPRTIYLSSGDSAHSKLPDQSMDLVVTDPPFFDNVHYSELADFFYAWQQLVPRGFINNEQSTRSECEVQDSDPERFAHKLQAVFCECYRVLKNEGLLVFTYHHSRDEGWTSIAKAILNAGFIVVNSHPVKSEMSVAVPKSQAAEPIQFDSIIVCRKFLNKEHTENSLFCVLEKAESKLSRLISSGFKLSQNDRKIIIYGQLLTTLKSVEEVEFFPSLAEQLFAEIEYPYRMSHEQGLSGVL